MNVVGAFLFVSVVKTYQSRKKKIEIQWTRICFHSAKKKVFIHGFASLALYAKDQTSLQLRLCFFANKKKKKNVLFWYTVFYSPFKFINLKQRKENQRWLFYDYTFKSKVQVNKKVFKKLIIIQQYLISISVSYDSI